MMGELGPMRLKKVGEKQQFICEHIKKLQKECKIFIARDGEDEMIT